MYLPSKKLFLAGGTGLAGGGVLRQILDANNDIHIRVAHRGANGALVNDSRLDYVLADLTRQEDCARVAAGCDCAVLAAAQTGGASGR